MLSESVQLWIAGVTLFSCFNVTLGIYFERRKVRELYLQRSRARLTMPERICGAWVYNDGKGRAHHCVMDHDHGGDFHRSETSMGRKVAA
jgi:hypothetical protein